MPIVPPMVSAATGALLVPYAAAGQARLTLLVGCYAMFGISLFMSVIIITLLWGRLVTYKTLPAVMVPTSWIVLGPLGQSVTAAGNLANVGGLTLHAPYAAGADAFALLYGIPTWGFAMAWLAIAASITLRAARKGLPFGLTWWSFTFPVGTCVTGTIGLAARTGSDLLRYGAAALFVLLLAAWLIVAVRTVRDGARGRLFLPAARPSLPCRSRLCRSRACRRRRERRRRAHPASRCIASGRPGKTTPPFGGKIFSPERGRNPCVSSARAGLVVRDGPRASG